MNKELYDTLLGFPASEYQCNIFDFIEHGHGNIMISATAGCGKTYSLVTCMKLVPSEKKCLFLAFNKKIVQTLEKRIVGYDNCSVMTIHSLGLKMCRRAFGKDIELDEYKYRTYVKENYKTLRTSDKDIIDLATYFDNISSLIDFSRVNLAQSIAEIRDVAEKYGIVPLDDEVFVVKKCLEWGRNNTQTIDYTDMVWLPNECELSPRGFQYDWIFGDEAQDFSIAYTKLIEKCRKRGTRTVFVGDKKQAINGFAGANEMAFDYLASLPNTKIFELPVTYRCPRKVVELAQEYVPQLQCAPNAIEGTIKTNVHIPEIKEGDMVLSRSNASLFQMYVKLLKRGQNAMLVSSEDDLHENGEYKRMLSLISNAPHENLGTNLNQIGIFSHLYNVLITERDNIMKNSHLDLEDATVSTPIMQMYDTIKSLEILAEGLVTKTSLINFINEVFTVKPNGIRLSTIHKAKGLEADNVYILCRSTMPSKLAKQEWEKTEEDNLIYVAYTRAKSILGFVSEDEIKPNGYLLGKNAIIHDLSIIEHKICNLYGRTPISEIDKVEKARIDATQIPDLTKHYALGNNHTIAKPNEQTSSKKRLLSLFE